VGALSVASLLGRLVRLPLRAIPDGTVVPILATRARGMRWIVGSGPHGCWLGFNEWRTRRRMAELAAPGGVVWDVGANVGSYTLLAAALVGPEGRVAAFEPLPANVRYLREHVRLNDLANVDVLELAAFDRSGPVRFHADVDRLLGRVHEEGEAVVEAVTLDDALARRLAPPPDLIKVDVEGGEAAVLRGAEGVLAEHRPVLIVSTHGPGVRREVVDSMEALGYRVSALDRTGRELLAEP